VIDTTNSLVKLLVDGVLKSSQALNSNFVNGLTNNKSDIYIARSENCEYGRIYMDEIRLSNTPRSFGSSVIYEVSMVAQFGG
jgi:hypothetical protein